MPPRITVVGSVNVDMVVKSARLPRPGETVAGGQFFIAAGGKGANQAVAAARLGAEVTLIAKVGVDRFGDEAIANFRCEGIRVDGTLRDADCSTGVALVMVDERGENMISVAPGANGHLSVEDIGRSAELIRTADVLMLQLETPIETVARAARIAAEAGVRVILDPAPASRLPPELWQHIDYLTPNEAEAAQLSNVGVTDEASARRAAEKLLAAGAKYVILTLGERGALLATPGRATLLPGVPVTAVDTTAAGDAFNGAFAWLLGQGMSPDEAVRKACLAASLSTTRIGAEPSLPTADELDAFASVRLRN